jgi:hypothetical protein
VSKSKIQSNVVFGFGDPSLFELCGLPLSIGDR